MDPMSLIIAALVAGATAGAKENATAAVKDAYQGLMSLLRRRFRDVPAGKAELERAEQHPDDKDKTLLRQHLEAVGADRDEELLRVARAVLERADPSGARAGKYNIQVTGGKGIAIGDQQTVSMTFNDND